MHNSQNNKAAARSVFMSSIEALANLGAVVVTFFLTPIAFNTTIGWVRQFTRTYYGEELMLFVEFGWMGAVGIFIFFITRMSFSTVLVMGGLAFAVRFL